MLVGVSFSQLLNGPSSSTPTMVEKKLQNEVGTRSERDINFHSLRPLRDKTGKHSRIHWDFPYWSASPPEAPQKQDPRLKKEIGMNFCNKFPPLSQLAFEVQGPT